LILFIVFKIALIPRNYYSREQGRRQKNFQERPTEKKTKNSTIKPLLGRWGNGKKIKK